MTLTEDPDAPAFSSPEHQLARIENDANGRARYVCSCGVTGSWIGAIKTLADKPESIVTPTQRARSIHEWHAMLTAHPVEWRR